MRKEVPTKKQVFDELRHVTGCCWLGGSSCHCYSRQLCKCFNEMKERLTRTAYTEEEIAEAQKRNAKAMQDISHALALSHEE